MAPSDVPEGAKFHHHVFMFYVGENSLLFLENVVRFAHRDVNHT